MVLAVGGDPLDHRPLDRHRAEHGQQRPHRARGLEAAVGEQPVEADGDAEPGERVGDRQHEQVVPVQGRRPTPASRRPRARRAARRRPASARPARTSRARSGPSPRRLARWAVASMTQTLSGRGRACRGGARQCCHCRASASRRMAAAGRAETASSRDMTTSEWFGEPVWKSGHAAGRVAPAGRRHKGALRNLRYPRRQTQTDDGALVRTKTARPRRAWRASGRASAPHRR